LTSKEGVEVVEVDLTGPANKNGVLVAALAGLGRTTFLCAKSVMALISRFVHQRLAFVQINSHSKFIAI
jgi:hypothetical protein